mmetsp:Transcript_2305/g.3481  ORF Transcript_2305/g.3481 Transcript_2305/m.3481 type:complete len:434 (-) Transcript_2305:42-1343(-)
MMLKLQKQKVLYMDAANFSASFFPMWRRWDLNQASMYAQRFCSACKNSGYKVVAFFDQNMLTTEAQKKWRKRREREVRRGERTVPQGCLRLVGDMLAENGMAIRYSVEADNDDTVASWAQHDGASVLSGDNDFLRYRNATYTLYSDFSIKKRKLVLLKQVGVRKSSWRDIIVPPPETGSCNPFRDCVEQGTYLRGSPSPLAELGNIHIRIRPLRAALYHSLGLDSVEEEFPVRDYNKQCVWDKKAVKPNESCAELLLSPETAVEQFSFDRPNNSKNEDWYKHQFALRAIIAEICCTYSGHTLLETLRPLIENMDKPSVDKKEPKAKTATAEKPSYYLVWRKQQKTGETNAQKRERYLKLFPPSKGKDQNSPQQPERPQKSENNTKKPSSHYLEWRKQQKTGETNQQKRERYLKCFPTPESRTGSKINPVAERS